MPFKPNIKSLDKLPGLLYIIDFETLQVEWANFHFLRHLGYTLSDLNSTNDKNYYLDIYHPNDLGNMSKYQDFFLEEKGEIFHTRYRLKTKTGEWRWFKSSDSVLTRTENGLPEYMIGIAVELIRLNNPEVNSEDSILTSREMEMAHLLSKGFSAKEIADSMSISIHTVHAHKQNAMRKLKVTNTAGLINYVLLGHEV